jgi:AcrR family transcriptional regulator
MSAPVATDISAPRNAVTKEAVVEAAGELFAQLGFDRTSMRDIASRLGISAAALYHHYESKDAILLAVAEPGFILAEQWMATADETPLAPETVRAILGNYYALLGKEWKLFMLLLGDPAIRGHDIIGPRLHAQARQFYGFLAGPDPTFESRIRASAAMGALQQATKLSSNHENAALDVVVHILDL